MKVGAPDLTHIDLVGESLEAAPSPSELARSRASIRRGRSRGRRCHRSRIRRTRICREGRTHARGCEPRQAAACRRSAASCTSTIRLLTRRAPDGSSHTRSRIRRSRREEPLRTARSTSRRRCLPASPRHGRTRAPARPTRRSRHSVPHRVARSLRASFRSRVFASKVRTQVRMVIGRKP